MTVVNTSDADMTAAYKTPAVTSVVTWNPIVMEINAIPGAHEVFDSSKIPFLHNTGPTHPVSLTQEQVEILLTSISARNKIGLLRSFAGDPGTPRLFDPSDIHLLSAPLQEAFARANAEEAVVFYREKSGTGARRRVASGTSVSHPARSDDGGLTWGPEVRVDSTGDGVPDREAGVGEAGEGRRAVVVGDGGGCGLVAGSGTGRARHGD